jgi:hypothetical protein
MDVSKSMYKGGAESPFEKSLGAIRDLLQQQRLVEDNDVLEVVLFGGTAERRGPASGGEKAASLIEALRNNPKKEDVTDFRLFFDSLAGALKDPSSYNSQVVLLASDLVHERVDGLSNEADLQDWAAVLSEKAETLQEIKSNFARTGFVVFTPDPTDPRFNRKPVQEKIWEDLHREFPTAQRVHPTAGRAGLADKLRRGLLAPPELTISRDDEDSNQLAFIVSNPNCYPLKLTLLNVQRVLQDGTTSEPVPFKVSPEEATLGGTGTQEGTRVLKRPIPAGAEWESINSLQGSVETAEGPTGFTKGTAGSWLKYRPRQGAVEGYLMFSPALRLDLDVQGHTQEDKTYTLTVRAVGQGEETPALAEGKFESPKSLSSLRPATVRIILPATRSIYEATSRQAAFRVTVGNGAELLEDKKDTVEILEDQAANRSNLFLLVASGIAFLATALAFLRVRTVAGLYPALDPGRKMNFWWWLMAALSLLPAAVNFFHLRLLRYLSPGLVDWEAGGLSVIVLFATLSFAIRAVQKARFGRRVLTETPPLSLEKYRKASLRGEWLPWLVGLAVTAAFALSWFFIRPPVSAKLNRESNPPKLHVVSD